MLRTNLAFDDHKERRIAERISVGLPATITIGTQSYTAKLINITLHGAMLEMALPPRVRSSVAVNCGSISADAEVMWIKNGIIGISFQRPIVDNQIRELISRYAALRALRSQKRES